VKEALLQAEGIEAGYGAALVLHGVHIRVAPGEIVSIIGPNGAGKSTLLKALYGLVRVRAGRVTLHGADVTHLRPDLRTRRGLNFVPQLANVFPSLTIAENLKVSVLGLPRAERRAALAISHRAHVLDMGRNAHEGPGAELLHDPKVVELYLGGISSTSASSSTSTSAPGGISPPQK
jgi:ABC-type branched-subunit amino acid transport system ATPase component